MKRSSTIATLIALSSITDAQPVLTFPANAPAPGSSFTLNYSAYVPPGPAGVGQSWDLSMLSTDSTVLVQHVTPGTTPSGESFPGATVAEASEGIHMYYRSASDGIYMMGTDAEELIISYTDQAKYLPFPCTYQTTWNDLSAAEFSISGFDNHRTSAIAGTVDGYGSLTLPSGTFNDVLRIHWQEEMKDSTAFFTFETVTDNYIFYSASRSYPVAELTTTYLSVLGQTDTIRSAQWVNDLGTGVHRAALAPDLLDLYPVPTSDILNFTWPASMSGQPVITITDAQGRSVRNISPLRMQGGTGHLELSGLAPGIYHFSAIDEHGQRAERNFVKQ